MQNSANNTIGMKRRHCAALSQQFAVLAAALLLTGCMNSMATFATSAATISPPSKNNRDIVQLPLPSGKIKVAVYNFRDQSGQYKPLPGVSSFSTAVSQGGTSMLTQALKNSGWFLPVEREGLQNLLTERKIVRAFMEKQGLNPEKELPPLEMATILIEGGVIGYDTNIVTGGLGAKYFGLGGDVQFRGDQVTVALRAIDMRTGRVLKTVSTTKTVLSREISAGIFRYVSFKRLLEIEGGISTNEPVQIAVMGAIEKAVSTLVIGGILENLWALKDPADMSSEPIREYLDEMRGTNKEVEEYAKILEKENK